MLFIYLKNPFNFVERICGLAKTASTHFVRLSASRTGLTQTFSTDPLLGSVGIYFFRQACQSRCSGLSASRTGLTQTFSTDPMLGSVERICGLAKDRTWIWSFGNSCTIRYTTRPLYKISKIKTKKGKPMPADIKQQSLQVKI